MEVFENILRFEGLGTGGGSTMACIRKKRVFSPSLGRDIMRCAEYEKKGGLNLGAFKIPGVNIGQIKDTLITGGVAVGGAVVTGKAVIWFAPMVNIDSTSKWLPAIEIATGIILGVVLGKVTNKPDLGAAFAIGPVVVNGLKIVTGIMAPGNGLGRMLRQTARQPQLGVVQDMSAFPPQNMYDRSYSEAGQEQYPAWGGAS